MKNRKLFIEDNISPCYQGNDIDLMYLLLTQKNKKIFEINRIKHILNGNISSEESCMGYALALDEANCLILLNNIKAKTECKIKGDKYKKALIDFIDKNLSIEEKNNLNISIKKLIEEQKYFIDVFSYPKWDKKDIREIDTIEYCETEEELYQRLEWYEEEYSYDSTLNFYISYGVINEEGYIEYKRIKTGDKE